MPAPADGPGNWAGAPSAVLDAEEGFVVAYRTRSPAQRGAAVVVARSADGERLTTVVALEKSRFGAESLERPAIVRTETGRWRLYVSAATPGSKHWRIDALEADDLAGLAGGRAPHRVPRRCAHGRQGPRDPPGGRRLARVGLLSPARRAGARRTE